MENNRETKFVLVEYTGHFAEWKAVREEIQLTEKEQKKVEALGWDMDKVLKVKRLLSSGNTPMEISKKEDISRSSVYKYKEILEVQNDTKKPSKDTEKTSKTKNVFCNSLIIIFLSAENTTHIFLPLLPVLVLVLVGYFKREYDRYYWEQMEHKKVASALHKIYQTVFDLSFTRYPIMVYSDIDLAYFRKLLTHYNNQGRDVILIEKTKSHTNNHDHWNEVEKYRKDYCSANRYMIDKAQERADEIWAKLNEMGYYDYLKTPKGPQWEKSKSYLEKQVQFYLDNPRPTRDQARKKTIIDEIEDLDYAEINNR